MLPLADIKNFNAAADSVDKRLTARLTKWELFALAFSASLVGFFIWVHAQLQMLPFDYTVYIDTADNIFQHYYYSTWILPIFWLLAKLPFAVGFALWNIINILSVFFAARVFGGRAAPALLSFQMFYCLFLGSIIGILVGGLALFWWGLTHKRWNIAGLGLILAITKFQIGLAFGLFLLFATNISWRDRLRVMLVPVIVVLLSLVIDPSWPMNLLNRLEVVPAYDWGSVSLFRWVGISALLLWLPPLLLKLRRTERFVSLAATTPMAVPYFQQVDLLTLFVLPVGWLPVLLGNFGFLFFIYQFKALEKLFIVPLLIYISVIIPAILKRRQSIR
ncbi:MAG: DUF2029 domain-containing protein [Chloroflexi bacterium]|nr:DUF2029 domain-containing protein [Chloroflexota bacterium]